MTKPKEWDSYIEGHFNDWINHTIPLPDRKIVAKGMRNFCYSYPEYIEYGWRKVWDLAEQEGFIK